MRHVIRIPLASSDLRALRKKQNDANSRVALGTLNVDAHWKYRRKTKPVLAAEKNLKIMAGKRERCMYCVDSHGTDIEHFWPKNAYSNSMYSWANMLWCCTECGRIKGNRFPLDTLNIPLLIDPTVEDPWDYIDFDPKTGILTARFDIVNNEYFAKGLKTVEILSLEAREALAEAYKKTYKRLQTSVARHVFQGNLARLPVELLEEDDHGLMGWCFKAAGMNELPFRDLRANHPAVWQQCLALIP